MSRMLSFLPALALCGGVLLISGIREQRTMKPLAPMRAIPLSIGGLTGKDVVVPEEERAVAGMSDYMMRIYGPDTNPAFTTYVGYYDRQVQGKTIHSPKNCLPGAGWEILNSAAVPLPGSREGERVNRVLLANNGVRALVYYWYQGRGRIESSEYRVKWNLLRDAALQGRTEEALVRIVVPVSLTPLSDTVKARMAVVRADSVAAVVAPVLARSVQGVLPSASL